MPVMPSAALSELIRAMFVKAGAPPDEAAIVADHLIESSLMGHDSHGVLRVPAYVKDMKKGVPPASACEVVRETPATRVVDAKGGLGIVAAYRAMEGAVEKARTRSFGSVGVHRLGHCGRLGAYPVIAAKAGMVGLCFLNGVARFTAPFGGTSRRLPPNPLAVAFPRADGDPVMLDITTSVVAGGKFQVKQARGERIPEGWMIDAEGKPLDDPERFFGDAAVLPLGGFQFGHKGFGLALVVEALAGGLTGAGCTREDPVRGGNGFLAVAIRIADFVDPAEFEREIDGLVGWVKSSARLPGVEEILIPGEVEARTRDRRAREGIDVEDRTWDAISATARELGVTVPKS
jgi:hydroxycarboxylate dehydrogenase B